MTERTSGATDDRPVPEPQASAIGKPAGDDEPTEVKGLDRRRGVGSVLRSPWVPWVIAALALAFGVFALLQRNQATAELAEMRAADRETAAVRTEANTVALRLTTFKGEEIEEWYAEMRKTATGDFAEQLSKAFDQPTRDTLREIGVVSVGEMENLFVQDVSGDEAKAFALVKQTFVNSSTPDPVEDHLRIDMTFKRVDGRWLASEVVALGPNGVIAPTGPDSAPDAGGDQ